MSFVDDSLARTDIARPAAIESAREAPIVLDLGWADESFSVYDHPLGLVFENVGRLDAEAIRSAILEAAPADALERRPPGARPLGLLMSPEQARSQREGGTWTGIVRADSWTNDVPVLAWLLAVQGIALVTLPAAMLLFRPLTDRGYLLAKPLGILIVGLIVWLLASLRWMEFGRESVGVAVLLVAAVSAGLLVVRRREMLEAVRRRWGIFLIGEAVFVVAFLAFVVMRMVNPDLWHSHLGGEKPMDLAYLSAVLKSSYMPPYDPWFSDGYLNYYYMGQFLVATLIHATGIEPGVAFNLAVALFFALTVAGAFSIVYNLAEGTRLSRLSLGGAAGRMTGGIPSVLAGLAGAFFVAVIGNLDGAIQVGQGAWRVMVENAPFGSFDFWRSSRMMAPDPPGHEITEFPFFTFLFADLHAHLMAIPFTLLALGLALALVLGARSDRGGSRLGVGLHEAALLAMLGVTVGALRTINAWDFPTYLLIGGGAVILAAWLRNGGPSLRVLIETVVKSGAVFLVGYVVYLPYHLSYETFFASVEATTNQTVLWQFLVIAGLFVFVIGSYAVVELAPTWRPRLDVECGTAMGGGLGRRRQRPARGGPAPDRRAADVCAERRRRGGRLRRVRGRRGPGRQHGPVRARARVHADGHRLAGDMGSCGCRRSAPDLRAADVRGGPGARRRPRLLQGRGRHRPDEQRVQVLHPGVGAAGAGSPPIFSGGWPTDSASRSGARRAAGSYGRRGWPRSFSRAPCTPSSVRRARNDVRFEDGPLTVDGMAYMADTVYRDQRGEIDLSADLEGIRWLRENAESDRRSSWRRPLRRGTATGGTAVYPSTPDCRPSRVGSGTRSSSAGTTSGRSGSASRTSTSSTRRPTRRRLSRCCASTTSGTSTSESWSASRTRAAA